MGVVLVGANPGALLHADGRTTAYASVWQVDYSERGSGTALILWHAGRTRLLGPDPGLSAWLADGFVRHFPEVADLPWRPDEPEVTDVDVRIDLDSGVRAAAGDLVLEIGDVLDRRVFRADEFALGGVGHGLSNVYAPCRTARLTVAGVPVEGAPEVDESRQPPASSAFLAVAEVWTRPATT
jgi:hypothetical protein